MAMPRNDGGACSCIHKQGGAIRAFLEIADDEDGDTYRTVYTVRFAGAIYVLPAFQKKSKRGIETPKREIEIIKARLKVAEAHYNETYGQEDKR